MTNPRRAITVVGSLHMDLIAVADRLPVRGESLTGRSFTMQPGGKAGNQAAQAASLGVTTYLVSKVGHDVFGQELRERLAAKRVRLDYVATDDANATGASPLLIGRDGEYASIIVPGAAGLLTPADIDAAGAAVEESAVVMLQFEIPVSSTLHAARLARLAGATVVLNASPAPSDPASVPRELWTLTDVLVVNAMEAARLGGSAPTDEIGQVEAASSLRRRLGVPAVVMTLGERGAAASTDEGLTLHPAWPVAVVDTVGAGDAFAGALAAELAAGRLVGEALLRASAAGALAVTRRGAFEALPSAAELEAFLADRQSRTNGATGYTSPL